TGDTVTLTVTLRGSGVLDHLENLSLDVLHDIKVYPDKPVGETVVDAKLGLVGKKTFKYALVPVKPGTYELDPIHLSVFVPKLGTYVGLTADLPPLVAAGEADAGGVVD